MITCPHCGACTLNLDYPLDVCLDCVKVAVRNMLHMDGERARRLAKAMNAQSAEKR